MMYILNIFSAMKEITIKELKDFIYENYYRKLLLLLLLLLFNEISEEKIFTIICNQIPR